MTTSVQLHTGVMVLHVYGVAREVQTHVYEIEICAVGTCLGSDGDHTTWGVMNWKDELLWVDVFDYVCF